MTEADPTERQRLASLQALHVLDSQPEEVFDAIARAASMSCDTPIALVCLIDRDRQWFKASIGLEGVTESPRDLSFCTHTVRGEDVFVVPDALTSPLFRHNPHVLGEPRIRAYAGAPIRLVDGQQVGTICVIDRIPRVFTQRELAVLQELARAAAQALEMRATALATAQAKHQGLERELALAQRLAAVAQHSDDAIVGKTPDSVVVSWNLAAERIFGYSAADMIGQPITRLFPPDRLGEEDYLLSRVLKGDSVPQFETVRLRRDGTEVHVSVSLSPIRDATGRIIAISKVARDITQRKHHQLLLQESEARYRALVDDQLDLLALAFPDGTLKYVNPAFARFFGQQAATMSGTELIVNVAEADRAAVRADLADALATREPVHSEHRWRGADGQERWLSWTHRALRDDAGKVFAMHSVGRDVTQRRTAEETMRASVDRLKGVYEATPAMLYSCDAEGRLLTVSDVWLQKLGYRREDVIGRRAREFFAPEFVVLGLHPVLEALYRDGRVDDVEGQMLRSDGSRMDVRFSVILERDERGEPVHQLAVMQDVSAQRQAEAQLEQHRERLAIATEANDIGIWELDLGTGELKWNERMFALFDRDSAQFKGKYEDWSQCVHPDDLPAAEAAIRQSIEKCRTLAIDFRVVRQDGSERHLCARATVIPGARGQASRVVGVSYDVTERTRIARELAEKHELLRVTLESIGDAVITTDAQGRVQWLNPAAERVTGWLSSEAEGRPLAQVFHVIHQDTREPAESPVTRCLAEGCTVGLADNTLPVSRNGIEFGIEDSASPIRAADGALLGAVLVFHDVSEQRRLSQEMRFRAKHDDLTGLYNRAEFEERLGRLIADATGTGHAHSLLYIDLDQFKLVNDACGHAAGDLLLKQVSAILQNCVRGRDTLARLGGDEFGAILEHCSVEQAKRVADKICTQMEEFRFLHDERRFRLGTSIGLVPIDARWTNAAAPLQAADSASYAAKEAGRNRVHVWFDTDQALRARMGQAQWGSRLEDALEDGRFELFGQRIVPLGEHGDGRIHVEVLLRMRETDGTLVPPNAFLPAAERFHMATRIDRWVVRRVFEWIAAHPGLDLVDAFAINLSGQSLGDRAFHRYVSELIVSTGVDARKLCFEITETSAITNLADATAFIEAMRATGARIALDDFGAGASSFGYLKSLPVDYLKIDGQFVRDLNEDALDLAAVRCFTEVAKVIGVKTVAEFVESDSLLAPLREIGVDYVQGYTVHRPEPLHLAVQFELQD